VSASAIMRSSRTKVPTRRASDELFLKIELSAYSRNRLSSFDVVGLLQLWPGLA
jgi:hypothetical protein